MDLIFKTTDQRGWAAANTTLHSPGDFFDATLEADDWIRDVYIETSAHQIDRSKPLQIAAFLDLSQRFRYRPFALGGSPCWALRTGLWALDEFVQSVLRYNENEYLSGQFRGVCVDIQPSDLPDWQHHKEDILEQYASNLEFMYHHLQVYNAVRGTDVRLEVVMPHSLWQLDGPKIYQKLSKACDSLLTVNYLD